MEGAESSCEPSRKRDFLLQALEPVLEARFQVGDLTILQSLIGTAAEYAGVAARL